MMKVSLFLLVALMAVFNSQAFVVVSPASSSVQQTSSSLHMTVLSYGGKKKNFKEGSPLSVACKQLGVNVKYSCKK
jgi:hypothetical protein